jgi:hypothetical protein
MACTIQKCSAKQVGQATHQQVRQGTNEQALLPQLLLPPLLFQLQLLRLLALPLMLLLLHAPA